MVLFPSHTLPLIKIDLINPVGAAIQPCKCCANLTAKLTAVACSTHNAEQLAEFLDFRGIMLQNYADLFTTTLTITMLSKYADEVVPILQDLVGHPTMPESEYAVLYNKQRQQLLASFQRTEYLARIYFYQALYGRNHPYGTFATIEDLDRLDYATVCSFYKDQYHRYTPELVLSGDYSDTLRQRLQDWVTAAYPTQSHPRHNIPLPERTATPKAPLRATPQATLRVGRILPLRWDDPRYFQFTVLNTILGGYFSSRLMSNVREDKGYTYGIYSQTVVNRDSIVFFITANVGAECTKEALKEIYGEIERLRREAVSEEELDTVRAVMQGEYIRSIDGFFERSERYRQMADSAVSVEEFDQHYLEAIRTATPQQLLELAQAYLDPTDLVEVVVGGNE